MLKSFTETDLFVSKHSVISNVKYSIKKGIRSFKKDTKVIVAEKSSDFHNNREHHANEQVSLTIFPYLHYA